MSVVEDNGTDLHHLLARSAHAELATAVEQRFIGAHEHTFPVVEVGRQRLTFGVRQRRDAILLALSQDLLDQLVRRGEIEHRLAGLVHD